MYADIDKRSRLSLMELVPSERDVLIDALLHYIIYLKKMEDFGGCVGVSQTELHAAQRITKAMLAALYLA